MKKPTIPKLRKKLWSLFAAWVKNWDSDCNSCGKRRLKGQDKQAGHIIPKSVGGVVLYHYPRNVYTQCSRCNNWLGGNGAVFAERVSKAIGFNITEHLEEIRRKTKKVQWNIKDLQRLIEALEKGEDYQEIHKQVYKL